MNPEQWLEAMVEARSALKEMADAAGAKVSLPNAKACHDKLEEHRMLNDEFTAAVYSNQPTQAVNRLGALRDAIPRPLVEQLYGSYVLLDEVEAGRHDPDIIWCLQDSLRALKAVMPAAVRAVPQAAAPNVAMAEEEL